MRLILFTMFLLLTQAGTSQAEKATTAAIVIVDVRTPAEFAENHLKDAINIDFRDQSFESKIKALDKGRPYALYCRSGNRSSQAEKQMKSLGFKSVENLGSLQEAAKKLNKECALRPTC